MTSREKESCPTFRETLIRSLTLSKASSFEKREFLQPIKYIDIIEGVLGATVGQYTKDKL